MSHKGGVLIQYDWGPHQKRLRHQGCVCPEPRPHEDRGRRRPSTSPGEQPQENPTLTSSILDSSLQRCERIGFSCVSHQVCGSLNRLTASMRSLGTPGQDRRRWRRDVGGTSHPTDRLRDFLVFIAGAVEVLLGQK